MIKLTGLWINKKKSNDGKEITYMSGKLNDSARLLVFKNEKKKGEKEPDYYLCLAEIERKTGVTADDVSKEFSSPKKNDGLPF